MAGLTGGELVARVLQEAGIAHVFTLGGGHIRNSSADGVWCINVLRDPEAYRKSGQVSMAI